MAIEVVEILGRSTEGRTRPYLCRGDDDEVYYVKGRCATRRGLIAEFICASLGKGLGLPLAPSTLAFVGDELIDADHEGSLADLGPGFVFASRRVQATAFAAVNREMVSEQVRRGIGVFDMWVRNGDRVLTEFGGNPNLLWNPEGPGEVIVIDHNLAFDDGFRRDELLQQHVFSYDIGQACADFLWREQWTAKMRSTLEDWDAMLASIPGEWYYVDPEKTIPINFSLDAWRDSLNEPNNSRFWEIAQ